jgi:hypothetical protein
MVASPRRNASIDGAQVNDRRTALGIGWSVMAKRSAGTTPTPRASAASANSLSCSLSTIQMVAIAAAHQPVRFCTLIVLWHMRGMAKDALKAV